MTILVVFVNFGLKTQRKVDRCIPVIAGTQKLKQEDCFRGQPGLHRIIIPGQQAPPSKTRSQKTEKRKEKKIYLKTKAKPYDQMGFSYNLK